MSDPQKKTVVEILNEVYSGSTLAGKASTEEILNAVYDETSEGLRVSAFGGLPDGTVNGQVPTWNETSGEWELDTVSASGLDDGSAAGDVAYWDDTGNEWLVGDPETAGLAPKTGVTGTFSAAGLTDSSDGATNIAVGTTGTRPAGTAGDLRLNSTLGALEAYDGATWDSLVWSDDLATVATTGAYSDLTGTPAELPDSTTENALLTANASGGWEESSNLTFDGTSLSSPQIIVDDATNPATLWVSANQLAVNRSFRITTGSFTPGILNANASATVPTLLPRYGDVNTGIGTAGDDQLSLIAGGVEGIRVTESTYPTTTIFTGAASGSVGTALTLENHETGADGGGVALVAKANDALDVSQELGSVEWSWLDESAGTVDFTIIGGVNKFLQITDDNVAIGNLAGNGQTGTSAVGYLALRNNTGDLSSGFGSYALQNNTGTYSNGFGSYALLKNTGASSNGFGYQALFNNTGDNANGLGYQTLLHNQNSNNTAIGYKAWGSFLGDTSGNKTFNNTDINASTDRITIASHGFGSNGSYVNLKYTEGTAPITGLTNGGIYQVKIIDANTIGFYEADGPAGTNRGTNITGAGSGTGHTLTPQFDYSDSIVIGNNVNPTASNQVVIGGSTNEDVRLTGAIGSSELSSDPGDPDEGRWVMWQSNGTGTGDDGDILIKITAGGITKTATLVDFSTL